MSIRSAVSLHCPAFLSPVLARLENSPVGSRLARGFFWSMVGTVISRAMMLAAMILIARLLGKVGYGELGMVQSTVGLFGSVIGFGLGTTATKYVAECYRTDPARAGRIISLSEVFSVVTGGLISLGLFLFSSWLAVHTINAPHLAGALRISAVLLFISAVNGAQNGALSGFEAFRTIARVNFFVGLLSFPILVAGAWFGGLSGVVLGLTLNMGLTWLLTEIELRKAVRQHQIPLSLKECGREWPVLWTFGFPALLSGMMVGPVSWICNAFLVNHPDGYGEMGIFNAANQWFVIVLFLPSLLNQVVLPILSDHIGRNDIKQATRTLVLAVIMNAVFVLPLIILTGIFSPWIMGVYGEGFRSGWPTLVAVLLTVGIVSVEVPFAQIIQASGRMWASFGMNVVWAAVFAGTTVLLIGEGAFGLASARGIGYLVRALMTGAFAVWLIRRRMEA